ncbi:MAG: glycine--tRNA ligase subunit alpha, partial [Candidatus Margulisiibacteriota bacterium]
VEITYGLERLAMFIQQKKSVYDLVWHRNDNRNVTYGDIYKASEIEHSHYNFNDADVDGLFARFTAYEKETQQLLEKGRVFPAYDYCLKCSHTFNLLDARGAVSVTERMAIILRIRKLARGCARNYLVSIGELSDEK